MFFGNSRLKRNIFSSISSQSLKIFVQIFYPPLMIFFWGIENFGIWIFLLSLPNIIQIFNFNLTDASVNQMAIYNAQKKYTKSNEIFQNTILFVIINILILSATLLIFFLLNKFNFSILENINPKEIKIILILLFASVYLKLFESIFSTCLQSIGKIHIGYNLEIAHDFFSKSFIIFAGIFYNSLVVAALIFFCLSFLNFFIKFLFFFKYKNKLKISFELISRKIILKLIKLSIGHMSDIVANLIKHSGTIFIIGIFLNPYIVGLISTVKTLFYFMPVSLFGKINFALSFEVSNLYGKKNLKLIKLVLSRYIKITCLLIIGFVFFSYFFGPYIYNYWLSNKYELKVIFLLLIVVDASLFIIRQVLITPFVAINKNIFLGLSDLIFTIIAICIFFICFYFEQNYIFAFKIFIITSLCSTLMSLFFLISFFKNSKKTLKKYL